jgi:hypothetical protein
MTEINCSVPLPLKFNCWKHHSDFIKKQIEHYGNKNISAEELKKTLLVIGESQMDLYVGKLSPQEICDELLSRVKLAGVLAFKEYKKWLFETGNQYKLMKISDRSVWTLRLGSEEERYIHIHPARYSPDTLRVKALTLKTAIAVLIISYKNNARLVDTLQINAIRKSVLNAPPVKKVSSNSAVLRVINILS